MPVQPQEHDLSSATLRPIELSCRMSHNDKRRRPATAPNSTSPSFMLPASLPLRVVPQKVESQTIHDGPLSRVFSRLYNLGTNAKKSREVIPLVSNQDKATVRTSRKLLLRHPSRRLSSASITLQTSSTQTASPSTARFVIPRPLLSIAPKSPTIDSPFFGNDTEESSNEPSVDHRKEVQLQMARLAKLKRHLGEDIPPEMVLSPTLHVDAAEFRGLAGSFSNPKKDQGQRNLDTSAPALQSSRLRKSRSLRDRKSVFELQPHGDRALEAVHKKLPYELPLPQTEVDFQKPRELRVRTTRGSDQVASRSAVPTPHSVHPPHFTMSRASTSERLQTRGDSVAADLALDNSMNSEDKETELKRSTGIEYPDLTTIGATDQRSPPVQSLHLGIRPSESLSALTPSGSHPELEVGVQISRRTRFWKMKVGKDVIQSVHPDDVRKRLRAMKAS